MELQNYIAILGRRKWVVILTAAITLLVALAGTLAIRPIYQTSATLRISTTTEGAYPNWRYDTTYADRLMNTYVQVVTSDPMLAQLAKQLGVTTLPTIKASIIANSELMQITAEDQDPIMAAKGANAMTQILIDYAAQDVPPADTQSPNPSKVTIIETASVPRGPSSPRIPLNIALGLVVGLVGGISLAFLLESLDTTLYSSEQIQVVTDLPVLGRIPVGKPKKASTFLNGVSPQGEAFRHARTHLLNLNTSPPVHTILVTSAGAGEGKSTVVSNLAYALAQAGRQVLVVDCDLRLPRMHKLFDLSNQCGLSNFLAQSASLGQIAQKSHVRGISVITSGPEPQNPAELLASQQLKVLLDHFAVQFDLVLLDSTSLLAVSDALIVAPLVDGVILVTGQAQLRKSEAVTACQMLRDVQARPIGVIVNRVEKEANNGYYSRQ